MDVERLEDLADWTKELAGWAITDLLDQREVDKIEQWKCDILDLLNKDYEWETVADEEIKVAIEDLDTAPENLKESVGYVQWHGIAEACRLGIKALQEWERKKPTRVHKELMAGSGAEAVYQLSCEECEGYIPEDLELKYCPHCGREVKDGR